MNRYAITRPVGLSAPCGEIEKISRNAHVYRRCGLRPGHFIIPLDSGAGRTTLIEYMTDMYREAGVMDFISGPDDYIEITFDGSLQQLKQAFAAISSAAVYTNEYCNIIGMDISEIAGHPGETQYTEFIRNCRRVCEHASVIFFVHSVPNRNEERLLDKLCETVENITRIEVAPYTHEETCELIIRSIGEHGIEIEDEDLFREKLSEMVTKYNICGVKEATDTADSLVYYADFSGFTPIVNEKSLEAMFAGWRTEKGRREKK